MSQIEHCRSNVSPHSRQNLAPSLLSNEQFGHFILKAPRLSARKARTNDAESSPQQEKERMWSVENEQELEIQTRLRLDE